MPVSSNARATHSTAAERQNDILNTLKPPKYLKYRDDAIAGQGVSLEVRGGARDAGGQESHVVAGCREHVTRQTRRQVKAAPDVRFVVAPGVIVSEARVTRGSSAHELSFTVSRWDVSV